MYSCVNNNLLLSRYLRFYGHNRKSICFDWVLKIFSFGEVGVTHLETFSEELWRLWFITLNGISIRLRRFQWSIHQAYRFIHSILINQRQKQKTELIHQINSSKMCLFSQMSIDIEMHENIQQLQINKNKNRRQKRKHDENEVWVKRFTSGPLPL